jgi:ubiquinone/menaquinone biosynthesis C-methylase UbiE
MLSEVIRVVKPGGRVVICTLSRTIFTSGLPAVYQLGELMRIRKIGVGNFNERYYTAEEMISLFRDAGFSDISTRKCSFAHVGMIDPLFTLARRIEPFVEERLPYLAYNICTSGRRPSH